MAVAWSIALLRAHCQCLVVGAIGGRGDLQLAEQGRIALGKLDDHRDENCVRLIREVGADARERAGACRLGAAIALVRGERGRHHVLAEAVVVEGGTGAFALDRLALAEEIDAVVLRSRNLRQHPPGFDGEDLDAAVPMIGLAAGESGVPQAAFKAATSKRGRFSTVMSQRVFLYRAPVCAIRQELDSARRVAW